MYGIGLPVKTRAREECKPAACNQFLIRTSFEVITTVNLTARKATLPRGDELERPQGSGWTGEKSEAKWARAHSMSKSGTFEEEHNLAWLLKIRTAVARVGEMDLARWWNSTGQLGPQGSSVLRRGFPRTHHFAQARSVFMVAADRCAQIFDPPGSVTLLASDRSHRGAA